MRGSLYGLVRRAPGSGLRGSKSRYDFVPPRALRAWGHTVSERAVPYIFVPHGGINKSRNLRKSCPKARSPEPEARVPRDGNRRLWLA
jgi:hypothetical protein